MPVISNNASANTALRYVNINTAKQTNLLSQLSSGSRVQKASDDPASLAIGTKLKSDSTALAQASINAMNAASVLNTADGGLSQIGDILQRLKALTTEAQSGTADTATLANMDKEYQDLLLEIDSIATSTRFNGQDLLTGTTGYLAGVDVLLGTTSADTITITTSAADTTTLTVNGTDITDATNAAAAATAIDTAIDTISGYRAQLGADSSRVEFRKNAIDVSKENADAATSTLLDADVAQVQTEYTNMEVLTEAGIAALQKANAIPQQLLQLLKS